MKGPCILPRGVVGARGGSSSGSGGGTDGTASETPSTGLNRRGMSGVLTAGVLRFRSCPSRRRRCTVGCSIGLFGAGGGPAGRAAFGAKNGAFKKRPRAAFGSAPSLLSSSPFPCMDSAENHTADSSCHCPPSAAATSSKSLCVTQALLAQLTLSMAGVPSSGTTCGAAAELSPHSLLALLSQALSSSSSSSSSPSFAAGGLPADVLVSVMALLPVADVLRAAQVCSAWRAAAAAPRVWGNRRWENQVWTLALSLLDSLPFDSCLTMSCLRGSRC